MSQIGFLLTSDIPQLADIYISLQTFDWNYDLETSIDDGLHSSLTASCKSLNQIFFLLILFQYDDILPVN